MSIRRRYFSLAAPNMIDLMEHVSMQTEGNSRMRLVCVVPVAVGFGAILEERFRKCTKAR